MQAIIILITIINNIRQNLLKKNLALIVPGKRIWQAKLWETWAAYVGGK